jgi:hypothetical protein
VVPELKSFDSALSQRSATGLFGSVKFFLKLPSFVSNTPLSLNQNRRPSGVCRNDQFGADHGEERREGVKEISPLTQFLSLRSNDFADHHCLRFRVLGFKVLMTVDHSCLRFRV